MSNFFYKVKNHNNEIVQGNIDALSLSDAAIKLEKKGFTILEIKEETKSSVQIDSVVSSTKIQPFTLSEKKEFFNSFYFLYKSGLSILEIFKSIFHSSKNTQVKSLCSLIIKKVERGKSLKESMNNYSNALGLAYTTLITAGEESGKLEEILADVIQNIKKQEEIKSGLISNLTYPVCMFIFAVYVALFFKFFVLKVFSLIGTGLCYSALFKILIIAIIKILIISVIIFAIGFYIYKKKELLNKIISFVLNIGVFANLMKNYYFSNFFSVFALAYSAGITAAESIGLANSVIKIAEVNKKLKKSESMIYKGCEVSTALAVTGLFSSYAMSQVSAGEKAGELEKMLKTVAMDYENKLEVSVSVLLKTIEPLMILVVGVFVACIAINAYKSYYSSLFSAF